MTESGSDEPNVRAEPVPNWNEATETWDWAWELHTYGLGTGFLLLGLYCVYTTFMLYKYNTGKLRPFFVTINCLVFLLCLFRTVFLFVDPYRSKEIFSELVTQMLFNLCFPCLTAGFSLVNWAFLESSKFKILSPKLHNIRILITIIIGHFVFVLTADFVLAFYAENAWVLVMLCQGVFVFWGLVLCVGFSYSAWRVYHIKSKSNQALYKVNDTTNGITGHFKLRKSKNVRKCRGNAPDDATITKTNTNKRFSLTGNNDINFETYDSLKDEEHVSSNQQPDHEHIIITDIIQSQGNNDAVVKTNIDPNNVADANGTVYIVNVDQTDASHENKAFGSEPNTANDIWSTLSSNESHSKEMDQISQPASVEADHDPRNRRNTLSKRATLFIMSVKKRQYGLRPVKRASMNKKTSVTTKMMRITVVTTMFAAVICLVNVYAMFGVFSVLAKDKVLRPWGFYAFHTTMRLCELGMGMTMAYLTTTPSKTSS